MRMHVMALVLMVIGCNANVPEGKLACTNDKSCPSDWMCLSGVGGSDHCFSSVKARDKVVMDGQGGAGNDSGARDDGGTGRDGGPRLDGGPRQDGSVNSNPCAIKNGGCDMLVECSGSGAKPTCGACPEGYSDEHGDGTSCVDIDECATDNGDCGDASEYACTNNDGAAPTCRVIELDCFNGEDDNDDGLIDCADPDCGAGAVCVEKRVGFDVGVVVDAGESCPSGTEETLIQQGLTSSSVCDEGCTCKADPVGCAFYLYSYADAGSVCADDVSNTGGTLVVKPITGPCPSIGAVPVSDGSYGGWRTGPAVVTQTCAAGGVGALPPIVWSASKKFCAVPNVGAGCDSNKVCVPSAPSPDVQCALTAGAGACSGYAEEEKDWYTGSKETRTCGACGCAATGGTCDAVTVEFGNDWSCNNSFELFESAKKCGYSYSPPAGLTQGNRKDPTCTASAPISGNLAPTGRRTLCCKPE